MDTPLPAGSFVYVQCVCHTGRGVAAHTDRAADSSGLSEGSGITNVGQSLPRFLVRYVIHIQRVALRGGNACSLTMAHATGR